MSPRFTPRPSLSAPTTGPGSRTDGAGVAEVHASAFVERHCYQSIPLSSHGVAEVHASAFVERESGPDRPPIAERVAEVHASAFVERPVFVASQLKRHQCRRGSRLGLR